jgi:hypothetical protein
MNPIINPTEVYSGMYARVNINFFAYNQAASAASAVGLPCPEDARRRALGGRTTAAEAFGGSSVPQQPYSPAPQYPRQQADTPPWPNSCAAAVYASAAGTGTATTDRPHHRTA